MPKMRGFLRSRTKIDDADWAIAEIRTAARLEDLFGVGPDRAPREDIASGVASDVPPGAPSDIAADAGDVSVSLHSVAVGPGPWPGGPRPPIIVVGTADGAPRSETHPVAAEGIWILAGSERTEVEPAAIGPVPAEPTETPVRLAGVGLGPVEPVGVIALPAEDPSDGLWQLPSVAVPDHDLEPMAGSFAGLQAEPFAVPLAAAILEPEPEGPRPAANAYESTTDPGAAATHVHAAGPVTDGSATTASATSGSGTTASATSGSATTASATSGSATTASATTRSATKRSHSARPASGRPATARAAGSRRAAAPRPAAHPAPGRPPARRSTRARFQPAPAPIAHCPYCAKVLEPAPTSSRRCDRCRQRIVVRRVDGVSVYLTEAAVLVFEAERRRVASSARWTRERDRWLRLAAASGAPAGRQAQLAAARLTEEVVAASRSLYMTTVDRAFRTAKRNLEWDEAARLRREQAAALYRIAGSPLPPPAELVALVREGVAAELRGISVVSRNAELVSGRCCDACRADDRQTFRIADELREPRLPHAGCPKGLCRCRFDLAARDRTTMRRYLRRRVGARPVAAGSVADEPAPTA